jgi:antitoxin component of RelBE/YafQ-DinJ toxin-antitoxin module
MKDIVTFSLRMPKDLKMALEAYAASMGIEPSKVVRWILLEHLEEEGYQVQTPMAVERWKEHVRKADEERAK